MRKTKHILSYFMVCALMTGTPVSANPMMEVKKINPIPMFMPILVKKSDELSLTKEQISAFATWRAENMAPALQAKTTIIESENSIKNAILQGESIKKINRLLEDITNARKDLTSRTLRCHSYTKAVLNKTQWEKLLNIYAKQNS